MSRGARWLLGSFMLLIALGFLAIPPFASFPDKRQSYGIQVLAAFPGLIAVACFSQTLRPIAVRLIAATVFAASLGYVGAQVAGFRSVEDEIGKDRSGPSLIRSLLFFGVFGFPAGYVTIIGRYPQWGRHAIAFGGTSDDEEAPR